MDIISKPSGSGTLEVEGISVSALKTDSSTVSWKSQDTTTFVVPVECSTRIGPKRSIELISLIKNCVCVFQYGAYFIKSKSV